MFETFENFLENFNDAQHIRIKHENMWDKVENALATYIPKSSHTGGAQVVDGTSDIENPRIETAFPRALFNRAAPILTTFILPVREQGLSLRSMKLEETTEVKDWMQDAEKKLVQYFLESDARVYREMEAAVKDALFYGNGALSVSFKEDSAKPQFTSMRVKELYILSDSLKTTNVIKTIMRKGYSNPYKGAENPVREVHEVWHYREDYDERKLRVTDKSTWGVLYKRWIGSELDATEAFPCLPVCYGRFWSSPGGVYGEGLGVEIIADVGRLHKAWALFLSAVHTQVEPAVLAHVKALKNGKLNRAPGAVNPISEKARTLQGTKIVEPVVQVVELNSTVKFLEMLNESLRFSTLFDILILPEISGMTASEIITRVEQKLQVLVPIVSGLQQELVASAAKRILFRMAEVGVITPPPGDASIFDYDFNFTTRFDHLRRLNNTAQVMAFVQNVTGIASMAPEAVDTIDTDELIRYMADNSLIPPSILRSENEVKKVRSDRAKEMAIQRALEANQGKGE